MASQIKPLFKASIAIAGFDAREKTIMVILPQNSQNLIVFDATLEARKTRLRDFHEAMHK